MAEATRAGRPLEVLAVASELFPLIKTGGLADVVGALPAALAKHGVHVRTLIPGYIPVLEQLGAELRSVYDFSYFFGGWARLVEARFEGLDLLVLDAGHLYGRPGNPYNAPDGSEWLDNPIRFAALAHAGALIARGLLHDWRPDVVHVHDWQAALLPAYLRYAGALTPKTVLTVHNLAFQGQFARDFLWQLGLPPHAYAMDGVEYYGGIGFLKAGILFADKVTTVSPRYAAEIRTAEHGMGLDGLLRAKGRAVVGIVNGIDGDVWNPATDPVLPATYDARSLPRRARNKLELEQRFGLEHGDGPIAAIVSRLTWQKGMDLVPPAIPALIEQGGRLVVLGTGDAGIVEAFEDAAADHPGKVGLIVGYDEGVSHLMQGGADAILVPSRYEPCGLTQLYGLRYGTVPVVARVGGLADTIIDANDAALDAGVATGIQFNPVTTEMLEDAFRRMAWLYADHKAWRAIQRRGMHIDVTWNRRAGAYAALFRELVLDLLPAPEPAA